MEPEKKRLDPNEFPVAAKDKRLVTRDGKLLAEAASEPIAEDVADRLNENAARKEEDRWAL
jgi:hypothetical protein